MVKNVVVASVKTKPSVKKTAAAPRTKYAKSARALATRNANHQDKRSFIMTEAARLFSEKGYQATTMDEISAITEIKKSTVYYYYKSKAEILFDICVAKVTITLDSILPAAKMDSATDGIKRIIDVLVRWVIQDALFTRVYFQEERYFETIFGNTKYRILREQQKQASSIIRQVISKGCASGEFRPLNAIHANRFIMGVMWWVYRWREPDLDTEDTVASATDFILRAMQR